MDANKYGGLLDINQYRPSKKLTDLAEDESTETSVIHHDEKPKHNRFYFTLCMDRTTALLKVQELVMRINKIIDDLSFLYSIVVQASYAHQTPSEYIECMKTKNNQHLLSLSTMSQASFINICGGLAKYWSDIDDQRSILKRVQSALQFSALGSVFMYPKDYAARTKWKVGDAVMIFKQDLAKWCPGKITKCDRRTDDIEIKYAILHSDTPHIKPDIPPLLQGDEDDEISVDEDGYNMTTHSSDEEQGIVDNDNNKRNKRVKININDEAFDPNKMNNKSNRRMPKVTFASNASTRGSMSTPGGYDMDRDTPRGGDGPRETFSSPISQQQHRKNTSKIDVIDAEKLAKIDFVNDTTLETITLNRYDRDYVKPMIIKNQKRSSFSVTIDHKVNRTSELLDITTGLGNAVRLNDRLHDICDDDILAGFKDDSGVDVIEENIENKENETVKKERKVLIAKNVHPIALMLVEVDQLSTKINLENRQSDMRRKQLEEYAEEKYDEDFIMTKVSKVLDCIDKHFNDYLTTSSQAGSDLASLLESEHTKTDSYISNRISVNENGKKGMSIKSEAFRFGDNVFALLLHNTDVAKSLMISRFIQKEIVDLCAATTEFRYDQQYLTMSMAIANLHYNEQHTKVIDSYRSWYKRCSDALKTIRYEGGNGVTHADVLFGIKTEPRLSPVPSSLDVPTKQIGFGIVHGAGSKASEPGLALQFQDSLNEAEFKQYAAFRNNLLDDDEYNIYNINDIDNAQPPHISLPPTGVNSMIASPTLNSIGAEPSPHGVPPISPHQLQSTQEQQQAQQATNIISPTSPISQADEKNKTITWITGRLDRKYTFV